MTNSDNSRTFAALVLQWQQSMAAYLTHLE